MRFLGGIPVDRTRGGNGVVEDHGRPVRVLRTNSFWLWRRREPARRSHTWKTGFHRIALAADVPIVATALDWGRHEIRFREPFQPTDDVAADIEELQHFLCRFARQA